MLEKNVNLQNFSFLTQTLCHKNLSVSLEQAVCLPRRPRDTGMGRFSKICLWHCADKSRLPLCTWSYNPASFDSVPAERLPTPENGEPGERKSAPLASSIFYRVSVLVYRCLSRWKVMEWGTHVSLRETKHMCIFLSMLYLLFRRCWECKLWFLAPAISWGHWSLSVIMSEWVWM